MPESLFGWIWSAYFFPFSVGFRASLLKRCGAEGHVSGSCRGLDQHLAGGSIRSHFPSLREHSCQRSHNIRPTEEDPAVAALNRAL